MIRVSSRAAKILGVLSCLALFGAARSAAAEDDCPLGSVKKTEGGETWCEPTLCDALTPCSTGLLCRPVPLCVEIGTLAAPPGTKSDAGQRLLVRQRCGADKSCPQNTTCSEKNRCVTREQAERAGLLTTTGTSGATPPSSNASNGAMPTDGATTPAKKSCGCHVPGTSGGEHGGLALAAVGLAALASRRRQRRSSPRSSPEAASIRT